MGSTGMQPEETQKEIGFNFITVFFYILVSAPKNTCLSVLLTGCKAQPRHHALHSVFRATSVLKVNTPTTYDICVVFYGGNSS